MVSLVSWEVAAAQFEAFAMDSASTDDVLIATYATTAARRLTLDVLIPKESEARQTAQD